MRIDVVTLFPVMVEHAVGFGVHRPRAPARGLWQLGVVESARLRDRQSSHGSTIGRTAAGAGNGDVARPACAGGWRSALGSAGAASRDSGPCI